MVKLENDAGPFLALIVEKNAEAPERRMQDMGSLVAAATASSDAEVFFGVALDGYARSSLYDLMTGYGSTATFEPDQIRHPMWLDIPEIQSFARLMMLVGNNDHLIKAAAGGLSDPQAPKKANIAITTDAFIKPFLRFYFANVAGRRGTPNLDEFVSYGTIVLLNLATHHVELLSQKAVRHET